MSNTDFDIAALERLELLRRVQVLLDAGADFQHDESLSSRTFLLDKEVSVCLRTITLDERETLATKCKCSWTKETAIYLLLPESCREQCFSSELEGCVSNTRFQQWIVLDFTKEAATEKIEMEDPLFLLPPGIHSNLMITQSIFKIQTCRVYRNTLIAQTYVGAHSAVINCGHITGPRVGQSSFFCDCISITVGAENGGGRELILAAEATMRDVTQQLQQSHRRSVDGDEQLAFRGRDKPLLNIIDSGVIVRDTPTIREVFLYSGSSIIAASSVTKATLFPQATIANSCVVSNILMQWNTAIIDNSTVSNVLMMEHSQCGPSSRVESSVMGPDTHASEGEIHASIIGPNTNAHHQSLLIGVLWPYGRGNVAYGANIGSNHTGRLPDQEATAGEGTFWGLSCVIKFPVDLTWSPYSIISAGTRLPPSQRICMPFSLIMENDSGRNEIIPGWVWQCSPYTLARNEKKYSTRRKAKRHWSYTGWKICRPSTIEMCRSARDALQRNSSIGDEMLPPDTAGIGCNILTASGRDLGIKAYSSCIQLYLLRGLLRWSMEQNKKMEGSSIQASLEHELMVQSSEMNVKEMFGDSSSVHWPTFPWDTNETTSVIEWMYQRAILLEEFPMQDTSQPPNWLVERMYQLKSLEQDFAARVRKCKLRDDVRGEATVPGYSESHVKSDEDPLIVETDQNLEKTVKEIDWLIATLQD